MGNPMSVRKTKRAHVCGYRNRIPTVDRMSGVDYGQVLQHPFEKKENPQSYDETPFAYVAKDAKRHILGVYGGNEVSGIQGNRVDLESDLRGITRPNTWSTERKHLPPTVKDTVIKRSNPKIDLTVNVAPSHLPVYQMWAYPATVAPLHFESKVCKNPEKY